MTQLVECLKDLKGSLVLDSTETLCCILEQDKFSSTYYILVQPRKTGKHSNDYRKIVDWDIKH